MYFVYAISSLHRTYTYVGISNDYERRVDEHNKGYNEKTKAYRPFKLIYTQMFDTRASARVREKYLKSGAGREFLKGLG